jgi:hypothetical protein
LRALASATDIYFMTNSKYPTTFADLDVQIGENCTTNSCQHGNFYYVMYGNAITAYYKKDNSGAWLDYTVFKIASYPPPARVFNCGTGGKSVWIKVCKSLGGKDDNSFTWRGEIAYTLP